MKHAPIPDGSALHGEGWRDISYADSYKMRLQRTDIAGWELIAALFHSAPPWVDALTRLRNRIVGIFGLKTTEGNPKLATPPYLPGQILGFFRIMQVSDQEVLLGGEDKHLDFRVSLMLTPQPEGGMNLAITTIVATKNTLGTVYLAIVKPVHRLIARTLTRAMARTLDSRSLPAEFYTKMADSIQRS